MDVLVRTRKLYSAAGRQLALRLESKLNLSQYFGLGAYIIPQFWARITGINSLTNATRRGTTRELSGGNDSERKDSMMNLPGLFREASHGSGHGSNRAPGLTLMEMLQGGSSPPKQEDGNLRRYQTNDTLPPMQKVVINDGPARETLRREHSNHERHYGGTPTSSALPSMQSSYSAGSFV